MFVRCEDLRRRRVRDAMSFFSGAVERCFVATSFAKPRVVQCGSFDALRN